MCGHSCCNKGAPRSRTTLRRAVQLKRLYLRGVYNVKTREKTKSFDRHEPSNACDPAPRHRCFDVAENKKKLIIKPYGPRPENCPEGLGGRRVLGFLFSRDVFTYYTV